MAVYKKPLLLRQEDLAEGIFAASGGGPAGIEVTVFIAADTFGEYRELRILFNTPVRALSHTIGGYLYSNAGQYHQELVYRIDQGQFVDGTVTVVSDTLDVVPDFVHFYPGY